MSFNFFNSISSVSKSTKTTATSALGRVAGAGVSAMAGQIANEAHKIEDKFLDKVQAKQKAAETKNISGAGIGVGALVILGCVLLVYKGR